MAESKLPKAVDDRRSGKRRVAGSTCKRGRNQQIEAIAQVKARGAVAMGLGSRALFERAKAEPFFVRALNALTQGPLVPVAAGVLI
jgi:hypothetical protein